MLYVGFFLSNLLLGTVLMHLMSLLFGCKPKIRAPFVILCLLINSASAMVVLTPADMFSFEARLVIMLLCYLIRIAVYQMIFRQIKLKIVYVCILSYITNTFYELLLSAFFSNTIALSICAFIIEAVFGLLIIAVIKRKDSEQFVAESLRIIPKRLYVIVMVFLYVFTMFTFLSAHSEKDILFRKVANVLMMPTIVFIVLILYWLVNIVIKEQNQKNISQLLSMHLENQIEYYEKVNERYTTIRRLNHDFKNHLLCLRRSSCT